MCDAEARLYHHAASSHMALFLQQPCQIPGVSWSSSTPPSPACATSSAESLLLSSLPHSLALPSQTDGPQVPKCALSPLTRRVPPFLPCQPYPHDTPPSMSSSCPSAQVPNSGHNCSLVFQVLISLRTLACTAVTSSLQSLSKVFGLSYFQLCSPKSL
jgi:hypothetical protein